MGANKVIGLDNAVAQRKKAPTVSPGDLPRLKVEHLLAGDFESATTRPVWHVSRDMQATKVLAATPRLQRFAHLHPLLLRGGIVERGMLQLIACAVAQSRRRDFNAGRLEDGLPEWRAAGR